jgi:hypothetical protein
MHAKRFALMCTYVDAYMHVRTVKYMAYILMYVSTYIHTGDFKIIGNGATVFNDFSVANWYKNPLKSVARFPIILQIAVHTYIHMHIHTYIHTYTHTQKF